MQYPLKSNHGIEPQSSTTKTTATKSNKKRRSSTTIDNDSKIQQQCLTEVFSAKQQWDGSSKQAESANRAVATFIACDFRPYSVVEKR